MWKLVGYDTFSSEWYDLEECRTEAQAEKRAQERLAELEQNQPTSQSGGQGFSITGHHEIMIPLLAAILVEGGQ